MLTSIPKGDRLERELGVLRRQVQTMDEFFKLSCDKDAQRDAYVEQTHRGLPATVRTTPLLSLLLPTATMTFPSLSPLRGLRWRTLPDVAGNPAVHPVWLVTDRGISSVPQMIPVEVSETLGVVVHDDVQESIQMSAEEERRQLVRQRCKSKK